MIKEVMEAGEAQSIDTVEDKLVSDVDSVDAFDYDKFWDKEFDKGIEDSMDDLFEDLLSESFNRDEDEIPMSYDIPESVMDTLDKFSDSDWESLTQDEKMDLSEELLQNVGESLGLERIPGLDYSEEMDPETFGEYSYTENQIVFNQMLFSNPVELVKTLVHELRHAYQHERAGKLQTYTDAIYKVNFDNYIEPVNLPSGGSLFFMDYWNQYVEVDARAFSNIIVEAMR